jgi:hypothetical protein
MIGVIDTARANRVRIRSREAEAMMRVAAVNVVIVLIGILAISPGVVGAADLWLQPGSATPSPGEEITLRLFEGKPFAGQELPYTDARSTLFQRLWRKGRAELDGRNGRTPFASFTAAEPGVQLIVLNVGGSASFCKALLVVGAAKAEDPVRYSEFGQRLEIVPQSDPTRLLRQGGALEVQVLFEREPLAGARIVAIPREAPEEGLQAALTDEIGLATLKLDRPGWWIVRVRHRPRSEFGRTVERTQLSSTLVLAAGG